MSANGRGGRTQHSLVCSDGRERRGGLRERSLELSAAAPTSFVIFTLFGREAEAAALPRAEELVSDEEVDESAHSAVAELPVTNFNPLSPLHKSLLTPFSFPFSQPPTSHFPRLFAMLSLSTVPLPFSSGPLLGVEEVLVLL
ncbi:hypothetical protein GWK47_000694 [Chionoecetes opilio]|uniref:Uncharacterized protein n=1 Tax=Chionoecetes opilio TaxID=41210 RepID=A0A8J4Y3K2_CHIOP|nr:hypothetical protein GWK47_000694 [Chionoecetes opilio]